MHYASVKLIPKMLIPVEPGPITLDMRRRLRKAAGSYRFVKFQRGRQVNMAVFEKREVS